MREGEGEWREVEGGSGKEVRREGGREKQRNERRRERCRGKDCEVGIRMREKYR